MSLNLEDIARMAGVSRSTVSRVINHRSDVNESTRKKVLQIIEDHNFSPNISARTLVTRHTRIIGILFPLAVTAFSSLYFSTLLQGIGDTTHQRDYATLLWWGEYGEEEERFSKRILQNNNLMEGLIIATHKIENSFIKRIVATKIPFVMLERPAALNDQVSYITIDNVQSAQTAVEHLIKLGRRRIGHITGPMVNVDVVDRLTGYCKTLESHHIPFDPNLVTEGHFDYRSGYLATRELLKRGAD